METPDTWKLTAPRLVTWRFTLKGMRVNVLEWVLCQERSKFGLLKLSYVYKSPGKLYIPIQQVPRSPSTCMSKKFSGNASPAGPNMETPEYKLVTFSRAMDEGNKG
jgi:hypothetical protein